MPYPSARQMTFLEPSAALDTFEMFWQAYPKQCDKFRAKRAYERAIYKNGATPELLLERARSYAEQREGQDSQFTKYPATWLNFGSWKNAPPAPPSRGSLFDVQEELRR